MVERKKMQRSAIPLKGMAKQSSRNFVSSERNDKNVGVLFPQKGTTKCESAVPSERNNKNEKMLFLRK